MNSITVYCRFERKEALYFRKHYITILCKPGYRYEHLSAWEKAPKGAPSRPDMVCGGFCRRLFPQECRGEQNDRSLAASAAVAAAEAGDQENPDQPAAGAIAAEHAVAASAATVVIAATAVVAAEEAAAVAAAAAQKEEDPDPAVAAAPSVIVLCTSAGIIASAVCSS